MARTMKCKNLDYMCRTCQRRSSLALTADDCHSEATGRRSSFPERSFALLRMTQARGYRWKCSNVITHCKSYQIQIFTNEGRTLWKKAKQWCAAQGIPYTYAGVQGIAPF